MLSDSECCDACCDRDLGTFALGMVLYKAAQPSPTDLILHPSPLSSSVMSSTVDSGKPHSSSNILEFLTHYAQSPLRPLLHLRQGITTTIPPFLLLSSSQLCSV